MALYKQRFVDIALAAGVAKSVLELATAAQQKAKIVEVCVSFDGVTPANTPVKVEYGRFSLAVTTASAGAAGKLDDSGSGNASITPKFNTTVEGAGAIDDDASVIRVPPTGGFLYQAPLGREEAVGLSGFWRMRLTAAQIVNASGWVIWEE